MATPSKRRGLGEKSTAAYAFSAFFQLLGLLLINSYPLWIPLTRGVVTYDYPQVVWAANLAAGVQLGGNLALAFARTPFLTRLMALVFTIVTLISAAVFFQVFPLDFARISLPWMNFVARLVLIFVLLGTGIAVLVSLVRLFFPGPPRSAAPGSRPAV